MATLCVGSALIAPNASAQDRAATSPKSPTLAPPVRLVCDGIFLGATRHYPSPVIQDVNGDGLGDLVLGDLDGRVTVSLRRAGDVATSFGPETPMQASDGTDLKFENW